MPSGFLQMSALLRLGSRLQVEVLHSAFYASFSIVQDDASWPVGRLCEGPLIGA